MLYTTLMMQHFGGGSSFDSQYGSETEAYDFIIIFELCSYDKFFIPAGTTASTEFDDVSPELAFEFYNEFWRFQR